MTARFKSPPFVSAKLRQFARGRECQMKSEWCTGDPETVVLCHSRRRAGAGMAEKPHDFWGYHGCYGCHSNEHRVEDRELYDAIRRTQWAVYAHFGTLTPGDTKMTMTECEFCEGTGECPDCMGEGEPDCPTCKGSGVCDECAGAGVNIWTDDVTNGTAK